MSLVSGNGRWLVAGAAATAAGYGIYQYLSSRKKTKPTGPQPDGRSYKGIPIPFFFLEESAEAFRDMRVEETDVFMSSLAKSGTTWVNKILFLILKGVDDHGVMAPGTTFNKDIQAYPEGLPMRKGEGKAEFLWGDATLPELLAQREPRLISTHLCGDLLPTQLTDPNHGTGKLVLVMRNVKDMLVSLHFFKGVAKDEWHGNEHGPGSLARYIADDCPNAYGSVFDVIVAYDNLVAELEGTGRVKVVYFEALKLDLGGELDSLAEFLGRPLSPAKKTAIMEAVTFKAMQANDKNRGVLLRKGAIGDWKNHLDPVSWAKVDEVFERRCGSCAVAQPLKQHQ